MAGVLDRIPFLAGYQQQGALDQQRALGEGQQVTQAMGILGALQQQQARAQAQEREQQFRGVLGKLGPNATSEDYIKAATPFMSADDLAKLHQGAIDKKATLANTTSIARDRINRQIDADAQRAWQFAMTLPIQQRELALKEINSGLSAARQAADLQLRVQGNEYNFGAAPNSTITDAIMRLQQQAQGAPATPQAGGGSLPYESLPPNERRIVDMMRQSQSPMSVGLPNAVPNSAFDGGPAASPQQAPQPQPTVAQTHTPGPNPWSEMPAPALVAPATPWLGDARDLGAGARGSVIPQRPGQSQSVIAPTAPVQSVSDVSSKPVTLADAPAGLSPRDKAKWLLQQTKPSIAGGGMLTPEALTFTAQQYLSGDRQAAQGYARNATARIALQNAIVDEATKQGLNPDQVAARMAEFSGIVSGSRTVGARAANIGLAATEAIEMIDVVKEMSGKFERTDFVPWNRVLRAYETNTGSPEVTNFGASLNALVNVYARAINPTGVATVSDKEHAREVINSVQSPDQANGVLGVIRRELEIAKRAPGTVSANIRSQITNRGGQNMSVPESNLSRKVQEHGWTYEPDKYDYRLGMDGVPQRKPK